MSMYGSQPELSGEITFRDMLRVNGHIAGTVHSKGGTLFIDASARVDANIEVGTVIVSGTVVGDIVAERRVEVGDGLAHSTQEGALCFVFQSHSAY